MAELVAILKETIPGVIITPEPSDAVDDEYVDVFSTDGYMKMEQNWHPGDTVRIYRENRNMTQAELAERAGMSIPNISLIENRKRGVGVRTARKLVAALGISVDRLIRPRATTT